MLESTEVFLELSAPAAVTPFTTSLGRAVIVETGTGSCVFGVPDVQWGEAIQAVVEVAQPGAWKPERVIDHVGSRIARYKKPKTVFFTAKLPRTPEGAIDREAVKKQWGK